MSTLLPGQYFPTILGWPQDFAQCFYTAPSQQPRDPLHTQPPPLLGTWVSPTHILQRRDQVQEPPPECWRKKRGKGVL